jgi:hypothetical protein
METMIYALSACLCAFLLGRLSVRAWNKEERPEEAATSSDQD